MLLKDSWPGLHGQGSLLMDGRSGYFSQLRFITGWLLVVQSENQFEPSTFIYTVHQCQLPTLSRPSIFSKAVGQCLNCYGTPTECTQSQRGILLLAKGPAHNMPRKSDHHHRQ